jgi:hypothetical protein
VHSNKPLNPGEENKGTEYELGWAGLGTATYAMV